MKTKLCVIALIASTAFAVPAMAQDAAAPGWAPWTVVEEAAPAATPAPVRTVRRALRVQVVASVAPQPVEQETFAQRLLRVDRFWVIGSFR